jgi:hypothetical protein
VARDPWFVTRNDPFGAVNFSVFSSSFVSSVFGFRFLLERKTRFNAEIAEDAQGAEKTGARTLADERVIASPQVV